MLTPTNSGADLDVLIWGGGGGGGGGCTVADPKPERF